MRLKFSVRRDSAQDIMLVSRMLLLLPAPSWETRKDLGNSSEHTLLKGGVVWVCGVNPQDTVQEPQSLPSSNVVYTLKMQYRVLTKKIYRVLAQSAFSFGQETTRTQFTIRISGPIFNWLTKMAPISSRIIPPSPPEGPFQTSGLKCETTSFWQRSKLLEGSVLRRYIVEEIPAEPTEGLLETALLWGVDFGGLKSESGFDSGSTLARSTKSTRLSQHPSTHPASWVKRGETVTSPVAEARSRLAAKRRSEKGSAVVVPILVSARGAAMFVRCS